MRGRGSIDVEIAVVSFAKNRSPRLDDGPAACEPMDRNVPRTRSVGRPASGAQKPHRPRAREPGAPTAARPTRPPIEATPIRAPRSRLLGVALQPVGWM